MDERYEELWEKFLKNAKIWKIKTIRAWHRFDKQFGVSRFAKKMVLAAGLQLITLAAPNAQVSLHAQAVRNKSKPVAAATVKSNETSRLLAKANEAQALPEYADFVNEYQDVIADRQKEFALTLWGIMQQNIERVQDAEKKGRRTVTLRAMFNKYKKYNLSIDPQYFCATGGLGSIVQAADSLHFDEYKLLLECLTNPNHCKTIINDFKSYFGDKKETSDIPATLAEIYKKNPYAVCIVFPRSKTSRSGYHYTTTFSNAIAVDTLLTSEDSINGKTARFNRTAIADIDDYYTGTLKRGYVFDITEMIGNYQVFQMFMEYLDEKHIPKNILTKPELRNDAPVAMNIPDTDDRFYSWNEVSSTRDTEPVSLPKDNHNITPMLPKKEGRLS